MVSARREWIGIAACTVLYFVLRVWNLWAQPLNALYDEGVHLGLMKLLAEGKGELYRDFLFVHPPGVIQVGAWLWPRVGGNLFALRLSYILFCSLALPPTYALVRRLYDAKTALWTLLWLCVTPGFAGWLGRNIMLDMVLMVPLMIALWMLVCLSRPRLFVALGAGILLGLSAYIKATALPIGLAVGAALWLSGRDISGEGRFAGRLWETLAFFGGFLTAFGTVTAWLWQIPHYGFYAYGLNGSAPFSLQHRWHELLNGFYQLPLQMTFGVVGAWAWWRSPRWQDRFLSLFAFGNILFMLLIPKNFFWRYLMPAMPVLTLSMVVWWRQFATTPQPIAKRRAVALFTLLFGLTNWTTLILYHTHESPNTSAQRHALAILRASPGPVFTLDPIWAAASGQELPTWRFACVAEWKVPEVKTPDAFTEALRACPTVLLDEMTRRMLPPETERFLRECYHPVYRSGTPGEWKYFEILRR